MCLQWLRAGIKTPMMSWFCKQPHQVSPAVIDLDHRSKMTSQSVVGALLFTSDLCFVHLPWHGNYHIWSSLPQHRYTSWISDSSFSLQTWFRPSYWQILLWIFYCPGQSCHSELSTPNSQQFNLYLKDLTLPVLSLPCPPPLTLRPASACECCYPSTAWHSGLSH